MPQGRRTFAFRWLLPISQLVLCVVALWPLRSLLIHQLRDSIEAYRIRRAALPEVPEHKPVLIVPIRPVEQPDFETTERLEAREWIPQTLNLPCGLVQLPYVILNPAKQEWVPRGMNLVTWRVISWPLVGILFWWIAGRGIEGIIAARRRLIHPRISWIETITGAALSAFCAVAAICMPLFSGRDEHFPMKLFVAAFVMWAVLGGGIVTARMSQWRLRRRLSPDDVAAPQNG